MNQDGHRLCVDGLSHGAESYGGSGGVGSNEVKVSQCGDLQQCSTVMVTQLHTRTHVPIAAAGRLHSCLHPHASPAAAGHGAAVHGDARDRLLLLKVRCLGGRV